MELSEAKERLKKNLDKWNESIKGIGKLNSELVEEVDNDYIAIDTILKALDNSISKDKVKNLDVIDISGFECVALEDIQELLGDD